MEYILKIKIFLLILNVLRDVLTKNDLFAYIGKIELLTFAYFAIVWKPPNTCFVWDFIIFFNIFN